VYFNKYGFNHIIRKGRAVRSWEEQAARFRLIPLAVEIIKRETRTWGFRSTKRPGSTAHFYTLKGKIGTERVRVIIRRKNGGTLHFFSVMLE